MLKKQTKGKTGYGVSQNPFSSPILENPKSPVSIKNEKNSNHDAQIDNKIIRPPKKPPHPKLIKSMRMTSQVYMAINKLIGLKPAERGGILLSISNDYTITGFVYDRRSSKKRNVYQPNTNYLNKVLKGRNEEFVGIAHSHPPGLRKLTVQDRRAAWSNLTSPNNTHLQAYLMPLIQTVADTGKFEIIPYIVICHPNGMGKVLVKQVELVILD